MVHIAPTQDFLNIDDIRNDILLLRNGEFRAVLEVTALNFALKSEQEQAAIVYQYQAFLNSLQFPIQIVVQSRQLDLTDYMLALQKQLEQSQSGLIRAQIAEYLDFIDRLITIGSIMEKHFYVVVPYISSGIRRHSIFQQLFKTNRVQIKEAEFVDAREKLVDRAEQIRSGLGGIGLSAKLMTTEQLITLIHNTYNPIGSGEASLHAPANNPNSTGQASPST